MKKLSHLVTPCHTLLHPMSLGHISIILQILLFRKYVPMVIVISNSEHVYDIRQAHIMSLAYVIYMLGVWNLLEPVIKSTTIHHFLTGNEGFSFLISQTHNIIEHVDWYFYKMLRNLVWDRVDGKECIWMMFSSFTVTIYITYKSKHVTVEKCWRWRPTIFKISPGWCQISHKSNTWPWKNVDDSGQAS